MDSIDLSSAVFDCKADAEEGTFEIKTPSRIITLKVNGAVFFLFSRDEIPGHSRAQVGGHSKLTIITDPDQPSEPWVPRVLYTFQSTFTPTSSLGSHNKSRDDGPILRIKKLSHKEIK